jgi:hypothetical protein
MNKLLNFPSLLLLGAVLLVFSSCKKDDPEPVNEEELITTVKLSFQEIVSSGTPTPAPVVFTWKDLDGDGPGAPVVDAINLKANTQYSLTLQFLNESENPAEDITPEIKDEEPEDHQIFFKVENFPTANNFVFVQYNDTYEGRPIGILSRFQTGSAASNGKLTVTLRHEPNKGASGVSAGDITNAGGETDVEAIFNSVNVVNN